MNPEGEYFVNADEETLNVLDRIAAVDGELDASEIQELIPDSGLFRQFLGEVGLLQDPIALSILEVASEPVLMTPPIGDQPLTRLTPVSVSIALDEGSRLIELAVGSVAPNANGSVVVKSGETVVLATVLAARRSPASYGIRFDYRSQRADTPGFERGSPISEPSACRLMERLILANLVLSPQVEITVSAAVLSSDPKDDTDALIIIGELAALAVSDIPFPSGLGCVRVSLSNGQYVTNPLLEYSRESSLSIVMAATDEGIVALDMRGNQVVEEDVKAAIQFGHSCCTNIASSITELAAQTGRPKVVQMGDAGKRIGKTTSAHQTPLRLGRADGRQADEIRPASVVAGWLPRVHGSALVTIENSQVLASVMLDAGPHLEVGAVKNESKRFDVHFDPVSAQTDIERGGVNLSRDAFIEQAFAAVLPSPEEFPYQVGITGNVLQSNGSDAALAVCAASVALFDAGVPLSGPVAGIEMGRVKGDGSAVILSDLSHVEEQYSDATFHVAGTRQGITALKFESNTPNITSADVLEVLELGRLARSTRIDDMERALGSPRANLSPYAPRIYTLHVPAEKIRDVIGPGGKVIRGIMSQTGVKIDVEDDGTIDVVSSDEASANQAIQIISDITATAEIGKTYLGKVVRLVDFGAFVEIFPGTDGLLHISEIAENRINDIHDELKEGDQILDKVLALEGNKIKLSRKAVLREQREKMRYSKE